MGDPRRHALARREPDPAPMLPYARHATPRVIALDSGGYLMAFALDGASFETADPAEINARHARLNAAWRNLADERLAVWHHVVRRPAGPAPAAAFRSAFARELDAAYRARLDRARLYENELFLSLVLRPPGGTGGRRRASDAPAAAAEAEAVARLEAAGRDLVQQLARYGPRPLGLYPRDGLLCSEPLEMLRLLLTGERRRVPLVRGHLGAALYDLRLVFGREALELRDAGSARYAGLIGIKEYPATTRPGLWDGLLSAPFPLAVAQSFAFLSKPAARAVLSRKQNQMVSARDPAAAQAAALGEALEALESNAFVLGEHQGSVLVHGDTPPVLAENLARARAALAEGGLVAAREDLGLEAGFWAQFPGNFRLRLRPAAITSRNFAALAPFHTFPAGRPDRNHWGPAVARLRTTARSPYSFSFHVGDLGHTFVCGPSGSGKTVVQNFLLAALEPFGAQQVFMDKDRGAEIFVRACGGTYLVLERGRPTGFAPFKALGDTPADRAFLGALVRRLVAVPGRPLGPAGHAAIDAAVTALLRLPPPARSVAALRPLLGQGDAEGLGARLDRWRAGAALGWALDGDADALPLAPRFLGFDLTALLDAPEVRTPVMMYLFHRLQGLVDGRRLVLDIDEFWKALGDEAFRGLAEDGLKTWRKRNAFLVLGTQSPADVLRSPIAHTLAEQCATKIYLPNPAATERDYRDGFGLSAREFELVREGLDPARRAFLVKQGLDSVVAELDLTGLDDLLAVLSGRAGTVALLERLRAEHGEAPGDWLPRFRALWRTSR